VEAARDAGSEAELARVLDEIAEAAQSGLEQVAETGDGRDELVAAVQAWASVASYATTRFYFEGPESILRRGGFSKRVAASLQRHAKTYSGYLLRALAATGASSFSVAVGFPFGLSVGLTWDPRVQAEQEQQAHKLVAAMDAGRAALDRAREALELKKVTF
jgi:hypothetical protein